jgi:hypothetical protein
MREGNKKTSLYGHWADRSVFMDIADVLTCPDEKQILGCLKHADNVRLKVYQKPSKRTTKERLCGQSEAVSKRKQWWRGQSGVYITERGRVGARERGARRVFARISPLAEISSARGLKRTGG